MTGPRADYGLAKTKQKVIKKPYNKLLTNRASSSRTGENRGKSAIAKKCFFFLKIYLKLGGKIHHFKAKKISFPTAYNLFTDN